MPGGLPQPSDCHPPRACKALSLCCAVGANTWPWIYVGNIKAKEIFCSVPCTKRDKSLEQVPYLFLLLRHLMLNSRIILLLQMPRL